MNVTRLDDLLGFRNTYIPAIVAYTSFYPRFPMLSMLFFSTVEDSRKIPGESFSAILHPPAHAVPALSAGAPDLLV